MHGTALTRTQWTRRTASRRHADAGAEKLAVPALDARARAHRSGWRASRLVEAVGATGRGGGALYTGRGPVCGTIMRGAGGCGGPATAGGAGDAAQTPEAGARLARKLSERSSLEAEIDGGATTAAGGATRAAQQAGAAIEAEIAGAAGGAACSGPLRRREHPPAGRWRNWLATGAAGAEIEGAPEAALAAGLLTTEEANHRGPRHHRRRRCRRRRRRRRFFLLRNRFQHISRPGDVRQINLGLDFFFAAQRARGPRRRELCFGRAAEWIRTFSASCSSSELEWVFFSVTPTMPAACREWLCF
jgi:hypothetical protein